MNKNRTHEGRRKFLMGLLATAAVGLLLRAVYLQFIHHDFLQDQGAARHAREITEPAYRGMILDRNHESLAVSSPVGSIWVDPTELVEDRSRLPLLASTLGQSAVELSEKLDQWLAGGRRFAYLRRHLPPTVAQGIKSLGIKGVYLQREYRRYYPDAEVTAHLLGFTNIDDIGQEGLELVFEDHLSGVPGLKRVVRDLRGRTVEELETLREPSSGRNLVLSVDRRIQYYAYRALKAAVIEHRASGGSVVVLDPNSGEILALVNQPAANPNNRHQRKSELLRNRAVSDVFEPGSTLKPFPVAIALERDLVKPTTRIDTRPGWLRIGRQVVRDIHGYGVIDVAKVISKSSNVGVSKIALRFGSQQLWQLYTDLGFGKPSGVELPGERSGVLSHHSRWNDFAHATHAFGYGLSLTILQLAQAYAVLATDGVKQPLTLLRRVESVPGGKQLLSARTARQMRKMMEAVVSARGTARRAAVTGYRVAGKTGTVHKVVNGQYADDRYLSLFAGMAPASRPQLVVVVVVDEPKGDAYYGGLVAAPVFSEIVGHTLRLLNVLPDADVGGLVKTAAR